MSPFWSWFQLRYSYLFDLRSFGRCFDPLSVTSRTLTSSLLPLTLPQISLFMQTFLSKIFKFRYAFTSHDRKEDVLKTHIFPHLVCDDLINTSTPKRCKRGTFRHCIRSCITLTTTLPKRSRIGRIRRSLTYTGNIVTLIFREIYYRVHNRPYLRNTGIVYQEKISRSVSVSTRTEGLPSTKVANSHLSFRYHQEYLLFSVYEVK